MNSVYLVTVAQGNYSFSPAQQNLVDGIADLCPSTDGTGVLYARAVKQYYSLGWPWLLDECMPVEDRSARSGSQPEGTPTEPARVYPNPAKNSFTLQLDKPLENGGTMTIIGMDGRRLAGHPIPAKALSTEVDASGLAPGIYIIEARADGQLLAVSRLTIIE